jgi:hypothetical protein
MKTCLSCNKTIPSANSKYCNFDCYKSDLLKRNETTQTKFVKVNGEILPLTHAAKKYNSNHYSIVRSIILGGEFEAVIGRDKFIESELDKFYKKYSSAPSKKEILQHKNENNPLKELAKNTGITYNNLNFLCILHGISTKFDQVSPEIHSIHLTENNLKQKLKDGWSAERIAQDINVSPSLVLQKIHSYGLYISPSFTSTGEQEVSDFIQSLGFTVKKLKTKKYEIDIFIPELQIGIEFNGIYWHSRYKRKYHYEKYIMCREKGIRLIQFWDIDWAEKRELIKKKLSHILGKNEKRIYARKCSIHVVKSSELRNFYNDNHIQGYKPCKSNYVLQYENNIVAAISIQKNKIERFASSAHVVGGFTRLLKHVIKDLNLRYVETFADLFWSDHEKNQYIKNGFKLVSISAPNYYWCKGNKMYSRVRFQKHKLMNMLHYDAHKTEREIMEANKYYRVYDAGNAKFLLIIQDSHHNV